MKSRIKEGLLMFAIVLTLIVLIVEGLYYAHCKCKRANPDNYNDYRYCMGI